MSKAPLQKYANARSAAEKKKMKTWKSADSLYQGTLLANQRNGIILDEDRRQKEPTETEETKLASPPLGSNKSGVSSGNFLTPTNPVELCNSASGSSMSGSATVGTTAPCFFCIRKVSYSFRTYCSTIFKKWSNILYARIYFFLQ